MQVVPRALRTLPAIGWLALGGSLLAGCAERPKALTKPDVDGQAAASRAMELYDQNSDGALDAAERAKCPPLETAAKEFDANRDGKLAADELGGGLAQLFGAGGAYVSFECIVSNSGRLLPDAVVKLRPLEIFDDALSPAEGTTDAQGVAHPGVPADRLPENLRNTPLLFPGIYYVEITHPQTELPAKYNSATELGVVVNPASRDGASARFDLK